MEFGSMSCCRRAIRDEVPKSIVNRVPPASTMMQVWKRPPLPKESPDPTNRTVAFIAVFPQSVMQDSRVGRISAA